MKKLIALLLALVMVLALAACGATETKEPETQPTEPSAEATEPTEDTTTEEPATDEVAVMTYEEFMAAENEAKVCVETYVQAHQSWWDNKITVYAASEDGAYFIYELACSEEDAAKLVPGTKIRVTGDKAEWGGEIEIMNATFEFVEAEAYTAEAIDATAMTEDELKANMNKLATFKGLTVEKVERKDPDKADDLYLTLKNGETSMSFCVEIYLTGEDSDVYKTAIELKEGDVVDVTGFIYWYEGPNPHITAIAKAAA